MLDVRDVSRRFGEVVAVDGLSLAVGAGEVRALVGRNGAGKTTTMRIVLGLVVPDEGDVALDGAPITDQNRRGIGYMPEERGLYPKMRVAEQVEWFGRLSGMDRAGARQATQEWLERLEVADWGHDNVEALSQGNQQRVQLAAALVHQPDLLVLDEPFSGLDPVGVDVLSGVLRAEVERGAAVVFSSHQLDLVEHLCDTVTIIDKGRVLADGGIRELRLRYGGRRLRVQVDGGTSWAPDLAGVTKVGVDDGAVLLELDPDVDSQRVLEAARTEGRVVAFMPVTPSLTDLFREVIRS